MGLGAGIITAILAFTLVSGVTVAYADGDPASDVLTTYPVFDPPDASIPAATEAKLVAVLEASARAGFPIKVAMIDSATDLGTVTQFWGQAASSRAQHYAGYLGDELSGLYNGQLLVVMPGGLALYDVKHGPHKVLPAESSISVTTPQTGPELAEAAIVAVPQLAKADGHPIPDLTAIHGRPVEQARSGSDWAVWASLAGGLVLVAGCWRWSLRARPLALRSTKTA